MPLPVALKEVIDGLEMVGDSIKAYINRKTGEIVEGTLEQELSAESDKPSDNWPDWQVEEWKQTRRVLKSKDFIALPSQFEIHEWAIMERFAQSLENEDDRDTLLEGLHGRGAFRRFERRIEGLGVREQWYKFRGNALAEIAIEFLEAKGIPYTRD